MWSGQDAGRDRETPLGRTCCRRRSQEKTTSIQVSRQYILTTIGNYSLVSRLLDGEFLDYQAAIPQGSSTQVTVSTRELIAAVDRASLIISDRLRSPLRLKFEENSLRITCTTSLGKAYDEVPCHIEGAALEMGFNNKYVLDALRAADSMRSACRSADRFRP